MQPIDLFDLRAQIQHRKRRVDLANAGSDCCEHGCLAALLRGQAQREVRRAVDSLEGRQVDRRGCAATELGVLRVARHADDLDLIRRRRSDTDPAPHRALAGQVGSHEGLVDDGHPWRGLDVLCGKTTAEDERELHGGKEIRGEAVGVDDERDTKDGHVTGNRNPLVLARARQERDAGERRGAHPWQSLEPLLNAGLQRCELVAAVSGGRGVETEENQAAPVESRIDVLQVAERSREEARAHEQHEREGDLHDHQRLAEA